MIKQSAVSTWHSAVGVEIILALADSAKQATSVIQHVPIDVRDYTNHYSMAARVAVLIDSPILARFGGRGSELQITTDYYLLTCDPASVMLPFTRSV
jgi:hypothetical protein